MTESTLDSGGRTDLAVLYERMLRIRLFEDKVHAIFLRNEIEGTAHLYQGQEAIAVGVCDALESGDAVAATYRGHGAALALGTDPVRLLAEMLGRETGTNRGRGGSMNIIDLERGLIGCFGIVGGSIAAATGAALASKLRGDGTVAVAFFGDGATNQAYFHECLNFASVQSLPVVFVCENNLYGEWTPTEHVTGGGNILSRADGYGMEGTGVDGNDVVAVREVAGTAVGRARSGGGPTLLEARTYRHKGHSRVDPGNYRPEQEVTEWLARDPLLRTAAELGPDTASRIREHLVRELDETVERAQLGAQPHPDDQLGAFKESR